ncbi:hypothetical protein PRIPAC_87726 [Pristionchus pacificus]|uniref:Uncharacterized protein n=1 Tax=Pristionchus pacificus TaxID=54126 RepID=A0A454XKK8_PRIPA|nr:hypothetical protein PRIPAC_87726 [Pristionchus pacificus]|eukprot:PDM61999.1 hypothetical protein PRIPAC_51441 [Pristionchus pacificus]
MIGNDYSTCFGASITTIARALVGIFIAHWVIYYLLMDKYSLLLGLFLLAQAALFGHAVAFDWRPTLVAALAVTMCDIFFHFAKYISQLIAHGYHYTGTTPSQEAGDDVLPLSQVIYGLLYLAYLAVMAKVLWNLKKFRKYGPGHETLVGNTQVTEVKTASPSGAYQEQ